MATIGRFEILGELGRGGMGVVLRGYDPSMAREVAIKVLRQDPGLSIEEADEIRSRFDREAKAAGALIHPGIVAHYDRGEVDGSRFIVMEYVEGHPLNKVMAADPRPTLAESFAILRQVAAALDYAHSKGVIHRDVKPANILIKADGAAKIADFGIAKASALGSATASSVVIGSPHYMSPEQIEARPVDYRTDQWALAVTAYELLTGVKPFDSPSVVSLFQKILSAPPPDVRQFQTNVPAAAQSVFARALNKVPAERFENCAAFVSALETAASGEPAAGSGPSAKAHKRHIALGIAIGAALVLVGALAAWRIAGRDGKPDVAINARAAENAPRAGEIRRNRRTNSEYAWVAPGAFQMGCSPGDAECEDDEQPHPVKLTQGFWMSRQEATVGQLKRFAAMTGAPLPLPPPGNPHWDDESAPASNISWDAATRFCLWAGGRLPTEAEWEFAARAGVTAAHYGEINAIAWTKQNSEMRPHPGGALAPNALGLYDMLGNVWEWTADKYARDYYLHSPPADPPGAPNGSFRVLRGGSWGRDAKEVRLSDRYPVAPDNPDHAIGFRCVANDMP